MRESSTSRARRLRRGRTGGALVGLTVAVLMMAAVALVVSGCGDSVDEPKQLFPAQSGEKWGYIDQSGNWAVEAEYDRAGVFYNGLAAVWRDGEVGYINADGEFKIEPQYANGGDFVGGPAPVMKETPGKVGFVGTDGTLVSDYLYEDAARFDDGMAPVKYNGKWGFIDTTGKRVIECTFDDVGSFTDGLARAKSGDNWGYIDKTGAWVIQPTYAQGDSSTPPVMHFAEGLAAVKSGDTWVYIDHTGATVIDKGFLAEGEFSEGLAPVLVTAKDGNGAFVGFIDKTGTLVIEPRYVGSQATIDDDLTTGFHNGLAAVQQKDGDLRGYIDTKGNWVIQPTFTMAYNFLWGDLALVADADGRTSYIDRTGKVVFQGPEVTTTTSAPATTSTTATSTSGS